MNLRSGQRLGRFEILAAVGAGGMGEVYRARDERLNRIVAIKILPGCASKNEALQSRFEREAKAISSLHHPNICVLYDVGHENDTDFLVMEYLEGETLAARLHRGPIGTDELFSIATQIAEALAGAHHQGVLHRDLKPANVMLTRDGAKLLDFGLAKLCTAEGQPSAIMSVTESSPITGSGTIVGTLPYMAPEQLEGKTADARSDIFAFGALLYELITRKRAFDSGSKAGVVAAVLDQTPPPVSSVNELVPPVLDRLVQKCLQKDPDLRWQTMRDLADELRWIGQTDWQTGMPATFSPQRRPGSRLSWAIAAVAVVAAAVVTVQYVRNVTRRAPEPNDMRFYLTLPDSPVRFEYPAVSPDGRYVAFPATDSSGGRSLWVRPLAQLDPYPLAGTEGANRPFWSPDSRFLAFTVGDSQIKKVPVDGGPVQVLGESPRVVDGSWGKDGTILLDGWLGDSIRQVPASGGTVTAVTHLHHDMSETAHSWPWFLPDGRHFLYQVSSDSSLAAFSGRMLMVGELGSDRSIELFPVDSRAQYANGQLLFVRKGVLLAQPFDPEKLAVTGEPVPLAAHLQVDSAGRTWFSASENGTLVFQEGRRLDQGRLVWVDRNGTELETVEPAGGYSDLALSPDGRRLAFTLIDPGRQTDDIWVRDLQRRVDSRLTFDAGTELGPVWAPDGKSIYYGSNHFGRFQVMRKAADASGEAVSVYLSDSGSAGPSDVSRDGRRLLISRFRTNWDILVRDLGDDSTTTPLCESGFDEIRPVFSPDGQYVAYQCNESGRDEIYIVALTEGGGKWQISTGGGTIPLWSRDGRELFYLSPEADLMAVPVSVQNGFRAGLPAKLFRKELLRKVLTQHPYAVSGDGRRLLLDVRTAARGDCRFVLIQEWTREIARR